jgi:hypothetical protein
LKTIASIALGLPSAIDYWFWRFSCAAFAY